MYGEEIDLSDLLYVVTTLAQELKNVQNYQVQVQAQLLTDRKIIFDVILKSIR